jgi:hypothetical protein
VSNIGKTLLRGHALLDEGRPWFTAEGLFRWRLSDGTGRAQCECGELSDPGITQATAKRWHRVHKDSLR